MRAKIRCLLAKYDYPPDCEEKAVEQVLDQAELFASYPLRLHRLNGNIGDSSRYNRPNAIVTARIGLVDTATTA
jgi:hypothetical protein